MPSPSCTMLTSMDDGSASLRIPVAADDAGPSLILRSLPISDILCSACLSATQCFDTVGEMLVWLSVWS